MMKNTEYISFLIFHESLQKYGHVVCSWNFIGGLVLSYSTFSNRLLPPLPADIESLNKRFGVIRSESLFTGYFCLFKNRTFLANIFYPSFVWNHHRFLWNEYRWDHSLNEQRRRISSEMVSAYEELLLSARQKKIKKNSFSQTISPRIWRYFSQRTILWNKHPKTVSPSVLVAVPR